MGGQLCCFEPEGKESTTAAARSALLNDEQQQHVERPPPVPMTPERAKAYVMLGLKYPSVWFERNSRNGKLSRQEFCDWLQASIQLGFTPADHVENCGGLLSRRVRELRLQLHPVGLGSHANKPNSPWTRTITVITVSLTLTLSPTLVWGCCTLWTQWGGSG